MKNYLNGLAHYSSIILLIIYSLTLATSLAADEANSSDVTVINGKGPGWRSLTENDFINVNCENDTWTWNGNSVACTGQPVGVIRTKNPIKNLELVCEWRHLKSAGNSGVFLWATPESIKRTPVSRLLRAET